MSNDTFNELMEDILTGTYTRYGSQPTLVRLFKGDRGTTYDNYIEIDQERNSDRLVQTVSGTLSFRKTTLLVSI